METILLQTQICAVAFLFSSATAFPLEKNDAQKDKAPNFNFAAEPFNGQVIPKGVPTMGDTLNDVLRQELTHEQLDDCADENEQLEEELLFEDDSQQQDDDYFEVEILTSHEDQQENASFPLVELGALSGEVDTEDHQSEDYWEEMEDNEFIDRNQNLTKHPFIASAAIL